MPNQLVDAVGVLPFPVGLHERGVHELRQQMGDPHHPRAAARLRGQHVVQREAVRQRDEIAQQFAMRHRQKVVAPAHAVRQCAVCAQASRVGLVEKVEESLLMEQ
ncbi:hypothetical protein [Streptomyces sp. NPDC058572]|uniref:hypothetical protein n=1 Tax=Streptomyces sp. NPDC058572 TaxID=3346546 RepID=UPI003666DF80